MGIDYREYLMGMDFSVGPFDDIPEGYPEFDLDRLPLPTMFDLEETLLPYDDEQTKFRLADICRNVPKMSTFAIGALINLIVSEMSPDSIFLNIGVWHGFTFFCGLVGNPDKKCRGVDNFSEFTQNAPRERFYEKFEEIKSPNHTFYKMDCFEYLENFHKGEIGFYMYDGLHTEAYQLRGLQLAEPFFSDNCLILIDDINLGIPVTRSLGEFFRLSGHRYEIIFMQYTSGNGHPSFWNGIILLQKGEGK
jgi:hypothetical protein